MTLSTETLAFANAIAARFDARIATASHTANLLSARKKLIDGNNAELLLACSFNLDMIDGANGAEHNVHALNQKLPNVLNVFRNRDTLNHYTRAIFLTARNLHANGEKLTQLDCKCVCDATFKIKKSDTRAQHYVVTATENDGATNSTQKSSSLVTLVALNVLKRDGKDFVYNSESHATKALETALNLSN